MKPAVDLWPTRLGLLRAPLHYRPLPVMPLDGEALRGRRRKVTLRE